jgi:hypothetical protein
MAMTTKTITLELPEELVASLDSTEDLADRAYRALVLDLLGDAQISQGRAARLLGITRADLLHVMAEHHILSGPETADEAERDVASARQNAMSATRVASD